MTYETDLIKFERAVRDSEHKLATPANHYHVIVQRKSLVNSHAMITEALEGALEAMETASNANMPSARILAATIHETRDALAAAKGEKP